MNKSIKNSFDFLEAFYRNGNNCEIFYSKFRRPNSIIRRESIGRNMNIKLSTGFIKLTLRFF